MVRWGVESVGLRGVRRVIGVVDFLLAEDWVSDLESRSKTFEVLFFVVSSLFFEEWVSVLERRSKIFGAETEILLFDREVVGGFG